MRRIITIAMLGTVTVAGCYVGPPPPPGHVVEREVVDPYGRVIQRDEVVEYGPPPPGLVEVVPVAPYPGAIWVRGFWVRGYRGRRWVRGHWR